MRGYPLVIVRLYIFGGNEPSARKKNQLDQERVWRAAFEEPFAPGQK